MEVFLYAQDHVFISIDLYFVPLDLHAYSCRQDNIKTPKYLDMNIFSFDVKIVEVTLLSQSI